MSGELVRRLAATPAERDRDQQLDRVFATTDLALARLSGIERVARAATLGTLSINLLKTQAELMAPGASDKFDLIATHAAIAMAAELNRLAGS